MKKLVAIIAFVGSIMSTMAAEITWTVQASTDSESDVRTDGNCLYAYTPATTEIKAGGVQFGRYTQEADSADVTCNISDIAGDAVFDRTVTRNRNVDWRVSGQHAPTEGDGYLKLLSWGWYRASASAPTSLTLNGLTGGKRYLVQIWICDTRSTSGKNKKLTLGGKVGDCYGDGYGSNFVGTFTADGESQTIALAYAGEANFNAFQVRCLDEATITWTGSLTSGESDIRTEGAPLYAYKPRDSVVIAGVHFAGSGTTAGITKFGNSSDPDIQYSKAIVNPHGDFCHEDASVPDGAISYSEAYRKLIDAGYFVNYETQWGKRYNRRTVTLRHLTPGKRYLVQLWVIDNRAVDYKDATVVVGFGTVLAHNNGVKYGHGGYAVGTFTAVADEQPISFFHRSASEGFKRGDTSSYESYGPIQVRCLDDEIEDSWYVGDTQPDGSVDTRGQPLWAFSGVRTTVSGTPFTCFNKDNAGDFGELVVKTAGAVEAQTWHRGNAFISQAKVEVSQAVTNLLGNGIYNNNGTVNHVMELHGLTAGKRYLVQAWFMDTRKTREGTFGGQKVQFRIVTDDTVGGVKYTYDRAPLGQYVTGIFRATDECYEVPVSMGAMQLNAIQVRELDAMPVDSEIRWDNDQTKAGCASVTTEGSLLYAYAPFAFTTDNGVSFAQGAYRTKDIGNGGDLTVRYSFTERNDCFAPNETLPLFKDGWYSYGTGVTASDNTITLGNLKPTYEYVVQVFVADLRNGGTGVWTVGIKDRTGRFGPNNDSAFEHGTVFTGRFTANDTTKSFVIKYMSVAQVLLNAIQVREIGPTQPVRVLASDADWTTDGAGWTVGGQEQTGIPLWTSSVGGAKTAYVGGEATLALGSDVTVGALYGAGNVTIGEVGTANAIAVRNEIVAPTATVNAVWSEPIVRKFESGTTVLAGACPVLKEVKVFGGELVLDGAVGRPLDISVAAPGALGFSTVRSLPFETLAGDGALAGPGGILLDDGRAFDVPASLTCVDGFTWGLANGSTLALPANYDASQLRIGIGDPDAYFGRLVVTGDETVTGKPKFVYGKKGYRAVREAAGWRIVGGGMMLIFR